MKEKIYTIPVNDAYQSATACPLCSLQEELDRNLVEYYLGAALMEPDVRKSTNENGFCRTHWSALYRSEENRLGLGLTIHTHLEHLDAMLQPALKEAIPGQKKGLLKGRNKDYRKDLIHAADQIKAREESCIICQRLEYTMDRYLDVIFFQYFSDVSFKARFDVGPGYCLPHLSLLLRSAARYLNQNQAAEFLQSLRNLQMDGWQELAGDVEWYTKKFDYRYQKESWKNSKDALPRAIERLAGKCDLKG